MHVSPLDLNLLLMQSITTTLENHHVEGEARTNGVWQLPELNSQLETGLQS